MANRRLSSIDLLRGIVMIIMALDHVRSYFHKDAFQYDPLDLTKTSGILFFTRWITHYCAPIFVFLAGISASLYGARRDKKQLSFFLFTRGGWLAFAEFFIVTFLWSFNPRYPFFNIQVIWVTGVSMMILSALIYLPRQWILVIGALLVGAHNLLDPITVPGDSAGAWVWSFLHQFREMTANGTVYIIHYPLIPWIGILALGYCCGAWYAPGYDAEKRQRQLRYTGLAAIAGFIMLRAGNIYGESAHWSVQSTPLFSMLSFLKVTKYPPSLLYTLMTIGPGLIFLSMTEGSLNKWGERINIFGRVPMFYYLMHLFLIHLLDIGAVMIEGHPWTTMILSTRINKIPELQGFGYGLGTVYLIWISVVLILYPFCKRYDRFKRANQDRYRWLSYL